MDRNSTSARKWASARKPTSGGERKWASDNTSFDKSSSSPTEKSGYRARAKTTVEGARLLQEHVAACHGQPPREVVKQTSEQIDALLAQQHITVDVVRAALRLLRIKSNLGPRVLPNLVFEVMNPPSNASPNVTQFPRRSGANVHHEHDAGAGIAEGF